MCAKNQAAVDVISGLRRKNTMTHQNFAQGGGTLPDKAMVNDALGSIKASLTTYANVIS